jgi:hypothetical protein
VEIPWPQNCPLNHDDTRFTANVQQFLPKVSRFAAFEGDLLCKLTK